MDNLTEINCKEIFKKAYENRYTWKNDFLGYQGKCIFLTNNNIHKGDFILGKDFKPNIQKIEDEKVVKSIASQLFEVCIHRVKREFESVHSENNFNLLKNSESGIEMSVSGKNQGDKYRVKNNCINMVYRKIHGTIIEIFVEEFLDTGIGSLSKKYSSQQIKCKEIFKKAYENRYTWNNDFNGYQGKCIFFSNNNIHTGNFLLGKDFKPHIQNIEDEKIVKSIASQLFEVCIHRVKREFESVHSENNFNLLKNSESGIEMSVLGKNQGDKYRVKNNCINMVYRKIHGTIIEIFVEEFLDTGTGSLSKKYTSQQINPDTLETNSQKLEYEDEFLNVGKDDYWILNSRTIKYINQDKEAETQKFIFESLCLLN